MELNYVTAQPQEMSISDYKVIKRIGVGSFGSASICHKTEAPHQQYVMKRINLDGLSVHDTKSAIQESELLRELSSPCIVKYIDSFVTNTRLAIIMEYCDGGDLSTQITKRQQSNSPFNENEIKHILYQIAIALNHCHSRNILHRDVKASNIFLTTNNRIKLGDFGVSRVLHTDKSMAETQIGTPYYLSPEICKGQSYSFKSDIWSFGCVLYELVNLHRPFEGQHIASLVIAITTAKYKPLRNNYSIDLRQLIESMLCIDPEQRPLTEPILNHKSLRDIKRKYEHVLHPKQKEDSFAKSVDELNGLTTEFTELQKLQNGLPRVSSSSTCRSSSESIVDSSLRTNVSNSSQVSSKHKSNRSGTNKRKTPISISVHNSKAKRHAIERLEKEQEALRKRAEMRMQRKNELRQHIKKNRKNNSGSTNIDIKFVGDFDFEQKETPINARLHTLENQSLDMMGVLASEHEAELIRMQLERHLGLDVFLNLYRKINSNAVNISIESLSLELPADKRHLTPRIKRLLELERM